MLRLVAVTPTDVDILFELVTFHDIPDREDLLAGLTQLHNHFKTSKDGMVKMVLTTELHKQVVDIVDSFMPADAVRFGIPDDHYMQMVRRIPYIQKSLANPDLMDPKYFHIGPPATSYLN